MTLKGMHNESAMDAKEPLMHEGRLNVLASNASRGWVVPSASGSATSARDKTFKSWPLPNCSCPKFVAKGMHLLKI